MKKAALHNLGCKVNGYETEAMQQLLEKEGYIVENIDATLIAQRPKMKPYIPEMRMNIAAALSTSIDNISVKATTEEEMGFTGRGEGISAHCVCLIDKI